MRAVVVGAGGDVDRDVADDPHAARGGVRAQRASTRARSAPGRRRAPLASAHSSIQYALAPRTRALARRDRARRGRPGTRARPRTPIATCTASGAGRAGRAAGPATTTARRRPGSRPTRTRGPTAVPEARSDAAERRSTVNTVSKDVDFPRGSDRGAVRDARPHDDTTAAAHPSQRPAPLVECGRYPAKACVGDTVTVRAEIFADGHEELRAVVQYRPGGGRWKESPMRRIDAHVDGDTWEGAFDGRRAAGSWQYSIEAWIDPLASWRHEVHRKLDGGQTDLTGELSEGALLIAAAAQRASPRTRAARRRRDRRRHRRRPVRAPRGRARARRRRGRRALPDRTAPALAEPAIVSVERQRARFSSWYELFPRSWGGFEGVRKVVPQIAELGFDVLYFTPIHPIGKTNRKGKQQHAGRRPRRPGQRLWHRLAGRRPRGGRARARHAGGLRGAGRARARSTASRSRWTSRCSARPTTRG